MPSPLGFTIRSHCRESSARVGHIDTLHGSFDTPAFMPVGTKATVKGILPDQVAALGAQILLGNSFHLMLRPGDDLVARRGGLHKFMRWDKPILTDSGGYQVYSLADINSINDDGVTFASIIDGSKVHLNPERSMEVQNNLGADIIMAFDDCPSSVQNESDRLQLACDRTHRWLERCISAHARKEEQALFGIVQGGTDEQLRMKSAESVCSFDLPGFAIGGVAVGETPEDIRAIVEMTAPLLPHDKPRYLMGVGYERDIVMAVRAGIDMFDCVLPTRNGRNGHAFTRTERMQLRNAAFREDDSPIDPDCDCPACAGSYSRSYIRHLFQANEMIGPILVSLHNLRHFQRLMVDIRRAIVEDAWNVFYKRWPVTCQAESGVMEESLQQEMERNGN